MLTKIQNSLQLSVAIIFNLHFFCYFNVTAFSQATDKNNTVNLISVILILPYTIFILLLQGTQIVFKRTVSTGPGIEITCIILPSLNPQSCNWHVCMLSVFLLMVLLKGKKNSEQLKSGKTPSFYKAFLLECWNSLSCLQKLPFQALYFILQRHFYYFP